MITNFKHIAPMQQAQPNAHIGNQVEGKAYEWNVDFIDRHKNGSGMT